MRVVPGLALLVLSATVNAGNQAAAPSSIAPVPKPHIVVLGTGGTIASVPVGGSETPALSVQQLIDAVPQLKDIAVITSEDVVNIESEDMTDAIWLTLAKRRNDVLAKPDVEGVVVTHGTDTLEETAYFLHLVMKSGAVAPNIGVNDRAFGFIAAGDLNPQKARVLLMLGLLKTSDPQELQPLFFRY